MRTMTAKAVLRWGVYLVKSIIVIGIMACINSIMLTDVLFRKELISFNFLLLIISLWL